MLKEMNKKLVRELIKKEKFFPSLLGLFINHNYLIRKGLKKTLLNNSDKLNGVLLDFGCGSKPYEKLFINVKNYIGVDLKIEGREENHQYVDKFYDGKTIPYEDDTFDSLLSTEVLEHVFNIEEVLKEMNRVLKKGGKALITTPFMWEEHEMPYDFARYTTPALIYLYEKNGFKIIHHEKSGNYVEVIIQFSLNYLKNIFPQNKIVRQIFLLPFIFAFNFMGIVFSFILPVNKIAYFNNIFLLEKK